METVGCLQDSERHGVVSRWTGGTHRWTESVLLVGNTVMCFELFSQ